jgi:hypothetical protein
MYRRRRFFEPRRLERAADCSPYARNETPLLVLSMDFGKSRKHLGNSGLRTLCCDSALFRLMRTRRPDLSHRVLVVALMPIDESSTAFDDARQRGSR